MARQRMTLEAIAARRPLRSCSGRVAARHLPGDDLLHRGFVHAVEQPLLAEKTVEAGADRMHAGLRFHRAPSGLAASGRSRVSRSLLRARAVSSSALRGSATAARPRHRALPRFDDDPSVSLGA